MPLVYVPPSLKENTDILLQQTRAPTIIDVCQYLPGNDREIRLVVGSRLLCRENRD